MKSFKLLITISKRGEKSEIIGRIVTKCVQSGGHKIKGDTNKTYYMLDEPNVEYKGKMAINPQEFYNKWTGYNKNKKDMDHYYDIKKRFEIRIGDEILARSKREIDSSEGFVPKKQVIDFTVAETEDVYDIDKVRYKEELNNNPDMRPMAKYVNTKKKYSVDTKDTNTKVENYGIEIILLKSEEDKPIILELCMGIKGEKEYKVLKKVMSENKVSSIQLDVELQNSPKVDKVIETGIGMTGMTTSTLGMLPTGGIPLMNTTIPLGMGNIPMGIPLGMPQGNISQPIPMMNIQGPIVQVMEQQRIVEQPTIPNQIPFVTTNEPQIIQPEFSTPGIEQDVSFLNFFQGTQK